MRWSGSQRDRPGPRLRPREADSCGSHSPPAAVIIGLGLVTAKRLGLMALQAPAFPVRARKCRRLWSGHGTRTATTRARPLHGRLACRGPRNALVRFGLMATPTTRQSQPHSRPAFPVQPRKRQLRSIALWSWSAARSWHVSPPRLASLVSLGARSLRQP